MDLKDRAGIEGVLFLLALRYLTRLPVPPDLPESDDLSVRSTKYFPAVGLLVGAIGGAVLWLSALWLPMIAAVLLSLGATLLVTGAFHEDGLADAADGLGAGRTRLAALRIMRDSRLGTYGALALGVVVGLKIVLLASVSPGTAVWLMLAGHVMGRMATVHVIATTRYARDRNRRFVAPGVTPDGYRVALATALVVLCALMIALGPGVAFFAVVLSIVLGQAARIVFLRRIGGYTGDCLGAAQQLAELGVYLGAALWL